MEHELRTTLKEKRAALTRENQTQKSHNIVKTVKTSEAYLNSSKIGIYHSVKGEADPKELITEAIHDKSDKTFYLPVLASNKQQGLLFGQLTQDTKFKDNKFGIPEPEFDEDKLVKGDYLDLVLVPLLGFDKNGNRLGMGGGFYDRCFAFKKKQQQNTPLLMGFAYDFQEIDSLSPESWDVGLDLVATETQLIDLR